MEGNVFTDVCLSTRGTPVSGPTSLLERYPNLWSYVPSGVPQSRVGVPLRQNRGYPPPDRTGAIPLTGQGYPPAQYMPRTGYATGSMPLVFSRRITFLFINRTYVVSRQPMKTYHTVLLLSFRKCRFALQRGHQLLRAIVYRCNPSHKKCNSLYYFTC